MLGDEWQTSSQSFSNSNCVQAKWRKSGRSHANGNCVETSVMARKGYRRSSHCLEAACVEIADGTTVLMRDSKLGDRSPVLEFSPAEWEKFLARVRAL